MDYYDIHELLHSGIKDMKWGQRRYQNPDGSLTEEGKLRYRKSKKKDEETSDNTSKKENDSSKNNGSKIKDNEKKNNQDSQQSNNYTKTSNVLKNTSKVFNDSASLMKTNNGKYIQKDYSDISDEELQKRIKRVEMEKRYGELTGDTKYIRSGSEKLKDVLQTVGAVVSIAGTTVLIAQGINEIVSSKKKKNGG